ncbi:Dot/Icm T4SS effector Zinc-dependent metalloprotease LegP [Spirosoma sp. KUDC1026]|uniref:Dot/Icm T4SS effector Zinc-dependent metalloprotease LegP n=1 Tax=Spirosoma sp. KUDC1026 TaxID=2745947 RepID=UPI00159B8E6C|nr:Dot/Icm T4SS effector Zinc-dependent metalloprotease LegP [Spirosoma sp. KUDC1026]QKZ13337.1 peptidase m12a astacin [Spirosoma sp. KUDC1026]
MKTQKVAEPHGEQRSGPIAGTALITGPTFVNKGLQYAEVDGLAIFEGDIILGPIDEIKAQADNGIVLQSIGITSPNGTQFRWANATIPYEIAPGLPNQQRVTDAIAHWEANTRIRFVLRTASNASQFPDYVRYQSGGGCSSQVGRRGGMQIITLGDSCSTGNAIHETGHTVGLWHEQSREDRNSFVQIVWANIDPSMQHNFDQHIADGDDLGAYDYGSIMHYPANAFSINGQATIIPLQTIPAGVVMGQRSGLSAGDINGVHLMYPRPSVTIKEVGKDPIQDPVTIKEIRKDPIRDPVVTIKEVRKDLIQDPITIKEVGRDPIGGTLVEQITQPGIGQVVLPGQLSGTLNPAASPFILAGPSRVNVGDGTPVDLSTQLSLQAQELLTAISQSEQQHAQLVAAYDATVQALNDTQPGTM